MCWNQKNRQCLIFIQLYVAIPAVAKMIWILLRSKVSLTRWMHGILGSKWNLSFRYTAAVNHFLIYQLNSLSCCWSRKIHIMCMTAPCFALHCWLMSLNYTCLHGKVSLRQPINVTRLNVSGFGLAGWARYFDRHKVLPTIAALCKVPRNVK